MLSLEPTRDVRRTYKATREFIAFHSEYCDPVYIEQGAIVFAELEKWNGWKWNGRDALQFFCDRKPYYVDRRTFLNATETIE